jgi:hypothetical protein
MVVILKKRLLFPFPDKGFEPMIDRERETGILKRVMKETLPVVYRTCLLLLLFSFPAAADSGNPEKPKALSEKEAREAAPRAVMTGPVLEKPDLSGEWEIHEEERSYRAVLNREGNGAYTWQDGRIVTTRFSNRKWEGTWHQPGNDREGGFELSLSEDGSRAEGTWWYTRVGKRNNIPPKQSGGGYIWNRLVAGGNPDHDHGGQASKKPPKTEVAIRGNTVTITFGPVDLPAGHDGDLAASMPKHLFELPKDMYMVAYRSAVFTEEGKPLPRQFLHHILLIDTDKESVSCPGEPLFFAGAGLEMTEARFPAGTGVKLEKGRKLTALVAFYHKAPPTKDVMASFTMEMAPEGAVVQPMEVYQVGVNVVCYSKFDARPKGETDEGIEIKPGVNVLSGPVKFRMDGCVKFAYPHGHDELLLITLENKTTRRTLLRTVPDVAGDGTFLAFQPHQVYRDPVGFSVNTGDHYEMTMVYHHPLHDPNVQHGMGNYLLYMTPGPCPAVGASAR